MAELNALRTQIQNLQTLIQATEARQREFEQFYPIQTTTEYRDIETTIGNGDQIQLESYRSIPEFSGNKNQYRSWRNQVIRRMNLINDFQTHVKYEAALGIIRSKITGPASDVLTNNKTAYNIMAIIEQLDNSYTDQRPLYIIEAEMVSIIQANKTLQEFYDAINQALNMVISKIVMSYRTINEQQPLVKEAQQKAIRTFIMGLKSQATKNILYGNKPKTLIEAYTTAQTVYYDNQYLHLDRQKEPPKGEQKIYQTRPQRQQVSFGKYYTNMQPTHNFASGPNVNMNCNQPTQYASQPKEQPEQKKMDTPYRFKQNQNWRQQDTQNKGQQWRENYTARQQIQQPQKMRINQIQDIEPDQNEDHEDEEYNEIPDDLISNSSNRTEKDSTSSAFLDE